MILPVGVVTGLARESNCLRGAIGRRRGNVALVIECAGARPDRAAAAADRLLSDTGCGALVSFGLAGGLSSGLKAGTVILADRIIDDVGRVYPTDDTWCRRLADRLCGRGAIAIGAIAGHRTPALTGENKRRVRDATGALAIDMESGAVATVATAAAVPFIALRAIADPWNEAVPAWLPATIDADGEPVLARVLAGCLRHPGDIATLGRLARDSRAAFSALRRVALDAGPLFQLNR